MDLSPARKALRQLINSMQCVDGRCRTVMQGLETWTVSQQEPLTGSLNWNLLRERCLGCKRTSPQVVGMTHEPLYPLCRAARLLLG